MSKMNKNNSATKNSRTSDDNLRDNFSQFSGQIYFVGVFTVKNIASARFLAIIIP